MPAGKWDLLMLLNNKHVPSPALRFSIATNCELGTSFLESEITAAKSLVTQVWLWGGQYGVKRLCSCPACSAASHREFWHQARQLCCCLICEMRGVPLFPKAISSVTLGNSGMGGPESFTVPPARFRRSWGVECCQDVDSGGWKRFKDIRRSSRTVGWSG